MLDKRNHTVMNTGELFGNETDSDSLDSISISSQSITTLRETKKIEIPLMLCIFCICGPSKCIIVRSQHQLQMHTRSINPRDFVLVYIIGTQLLVALSKAFLYTTSPSFLLLKGAFRQSSNPLLHTNFENVKIVDSEKTNTNFKNIFSGIYKCYFLSLDENNAEFYDELEEWGEKNTLHFFDNINKEEVQLLKNILSKYL